jgi:hypothetical protein
MMLWLGWAEPDHPVSFIGFSMLVVNFKLEEVGGGVQTPFLFMTFKMIKMAALHLHCLFAFKFVYFLQHKCLIISLYLRLGTHLKLFGIESIMLSKSVPTL